MNFNNFTIKSQEAVQKAVDMALGGDGRRRKPYRIFIPETWSQYRDVEVGSRPGGRVVAQSERRRAVFEQGE